MEPLSYLNYLTTMLIIYSIIFLIACVILAKSGALLVKSLKKLALYFHLSEFTIAFILVGIVTSLPELFVGITSALGKASNLSLGNAIGSNIVDLTLIIGLTVVLTRGIRVRSSIAGKDTLYMSIIALLPFLFILNGHLSRIEGGILVGVFLLYLLRLFYRKKEFERSVFSQIKNVSVKIRNRSKPLISNLLFSVLGLFLLILSAWLIVKTSSILALALNIPLVLVGLLIVSIGTSLPELAFGIKAGFSGHKEMIIGNLFGSVIANSCLVLGVTSLIYPITLTNVNLFLITAFFMLISVMLFATFIRSKEKLSSLEGILLIAIYVIFIIVTFMAR